MASSKPKPKTVGQEFADQLNDSLQKAIHAPLAGARDLPKLTGLKLHGGFLEPQENVLLRATNILVGSGRVFRYGNTIVIEHPRFDGCGMTLASIREGTVVVTGAEDLLANIVVCEIGLDQFAIPKWFVDLLLRSEPLIKRLPHIRHYSTKPVFDDEFILRGPGWHPEPRILVHGFEIEPIELDVEVNASSAIDRLPPCLRMLLSGFCFKANADVANTVGVLVTGLLMNHFVSDGKAVVLVDGNQPGLGKTMLIRTIGMIFDGVDPRLIHFSHNDEELQKRICATLRDNRQSILLIDNAKVRSGAVVSSPTIEANSMAPEVSLRLLGKSENFVQPNDLIWALTMNGTRTSPDLVHRSLPIQLMYEGRPEDRTFNGPDPIAYARSHRDEILGELAGMVVHWNQNGRPAGGQSHRLGPWARTIGGILGAAGLPEFLENAVSAAASFNSELDELAALAEVVIQDAGPYIEHGH